MWPRWPHTAHHAGSLSYFNLKFFLFFFMTSETTFFSGLVISIFTWTRKKFPLKSWDLGSCPLSLRETWWPGRSRQADNGFGSIPPPCLRNRWWSRKAIIRITEQWLLLSLWRSRGPHPWHVPNRQDKKTERYRGCRLVDETWPRALDPTQLAFSRRTNVGHRVCQYGHGAIAIQRVASCGRSSSPITTSSRLSSVNPSSFIIALTSPMAVPEPGAELSIRPLARDFSYPRR